MELGAWREGRPTICLGNAWPLGLNGIHSMLSTVSPNPSGHNSTSLLFASLPRSCYTYHHHNHLLPQDHLHHHLLLHRSHMEKGSVAAVEAPGAVRAEDDHGNSSALRTSETFLRLLPIGLSVAALVLMLNDSQANDYGSLAYTDLAAFRYLVHANGICAGYSLLSAAIVAMPRPSTMSRAWTFFLLDQVLTYIILGAGSVSTEALYLAEKGNAATMWSSACGSFGRFCHKATASVTITFLAVACYVLLSLISSYKLFSKFDAPATDPTAATTKGIDIPAFHA